MADEKTPKTYFPPESEKVGDDVAFNVSKSTEVKCLSAKWLLIART